MVKPWLYESLSNHGRPWLETVFNHGKTMADHGLFMLLSPGREETMHQLVAYKKVELQKIKKSPALKKVVGRWSFYEKFQLKGFDWENFGVLDKWSIMGGGRTWKFDCSGTP